MQRSCKGNRTCGAEAPLQLPYRYLQTHGISASYAKLTDKIINRRGDGICPMEQAVINIADAEEGYLALKSKLEEMRRNK